MYVLNRFIVLSEASEIRLAVFRPWLNTLIAF